MPVNPNTNFTAGQILTADQQNRFGRGVMSYTTRNTNYQPTSTIGDLFTLTFTAVANRLYRYSVVVPAVDSSGALQLEIYLTDNSNNVLNTCLQQLYGAAQQFNINFSTLRTETAGSTTRKIRMKTSSGNASMFSSTSIGSFIIEDLGPA